MDFIFTLATFSDVFDVDAEFLGQVSEDGEDDAGRDDGGDEVQRRHDRCVNVNLTIFRKVLI